MLNIETLKFDENAVGVIKETKFGEKWPVVYIINNDKEAYIGETTNAFVRTNQHLANAVRRNLIDIHLITDDEFNKSAVLDIESSLIKYMSGDGLFKLQNANNGITFHNYYEMEKYERKFKEIWVKLRKKGLVNKELREIENSDLFKYSPYKALTTDQYLTVNYILDDLAKDVYNKEATTFIVSGGAGTGKTVLGVYLMKLLIEAKSGNLVVEDDEVEHTVKEILKINETVEDLKIGLVIPMTSLRRTLKNVFKGIKGLDPKMVISPNDASKEEYDLLIVDEAHRLRRRQNLTQYKSFDDNNKRLGLDKNATELDWIMKNSKYQIMFYDSNQSIKPTDVRESDFNKLIFTNKIRPYGLDSQLRCKGGNDYIKYIKEIFSSEPPKKRLKFKDYDFKLFNNVEELVSAIKDKNDEHGLSRVIAGYSWKWNTKGKTLQQIEKEGLYDIKIGNNKYIWNLTAEDWVNSENSINEVGCIHTIQGYDLNYTGVILGNEIKYDPINKKIFIDKKEYFDTKGKNAIVDDKELYNYIINIYITMLTRGIKGTYLYVCNENLKKYLKDFI